MPNRFGAQEAKMYRIFSVIAVRRFNEGRVPSETKLRAWALGAGLTAVVVAIALG